MARFSRVEVWTAMEEVGLVPTFYHPDVEVSRQVVQALFDGGARAVEYMNRGDGATDVFRELAAHFERTEPQLILGAGSIVDAATAALCINMGAAFIVGPLFNAEVARLCNRRKVAYCPGCSTPTEISAAEEWGVEIGKLFPGEQLGGPGYVRAVKGPMPWVKLLVTGGVRATQENLAEWVRAGVTCLGIGTDLVRHDLVARQDWAGITSLTRQCIAWIAEARAAR